jgi:hypothetical protein
MFLKCLIYLALFFVLVPGVIVQIPAHASLQMQAAVHALVFAVATYLVHQYVLPSLERFDNPSTKVNPSCPSGYKQCPSGDCVLISDVHAPCPA